jgi:hypothetical protein
MINLIPHDVKTERMYGRRNRSLIAYSAALLTTAAITAGIMVAGLQFVGSDENRLRTEINDNQVTILTLEKQINAIEKIARRLDTAKQIKDQSVNFSDLIPKIGAVLPDGVVLNSLSLSGGATDPLQLELDMTNASLGPITIKNLVDSGLFEAADISSLIPKGSSAEQTDPATAQSVYQFSAAISASFTGTAEAKKKATADAAKKAAEAQAASEEGAKTQ